MPVNPLSAHKLGKGEGLTSYHTCFVTSSRRGVTFPLDIPAYISSKQGHFVT